MKIDTSRSHNAGDRRRHPGLLRDSWVRTTAVTYTKIVSQWLISRAARVRWAAAVVIMSSRPRRVVGGGKCEASGWLHAQSKLPDAAKSSQRLYSAGTYTLILITKREKPGFGILERKKREQVSDGARQGGIRGFDVHFELVVLMLDQQSEMVPVHRGRVHRCR